MLWQIVKNYRKALSICIININHALLNNRSHGTDVSAYKSYFTPINRRTFLQININYAYFVSAPLLEGR